jgi:DNA repair protein RadC
MKIKEMQVIDRPRERLLNVGPSNISNEELLSILIKTGTKRKSAKEIASEILSNVNDISELSNIDYNFLKKINGIGTVKAIDILASIELGKRINTKISSINNIKFTNPSIIFEYYKNSLAKSKQEHFYAVYLDSSKKIVKEKMLFKGTVNHSLVHPREVFKEAYKCDATAIICIHNHPSGNLMPSRDDLETTSKLIEIGKLFNIHIIDHIIIAETGYYSFYENGDI